MRVEVSGTVRMSMTYSFSTVRSTIAVQCLHCIIVKLGMLNNLIIM
jgi:hypothetical protein